MNRQQFLRRSALFSLAATSLPRIASAFQDDSGDETYYKSEPIRRSDESYLQYSTHFNFETLTEKEPAAPVRIIITVSDFSSATAATGPSSIYTLERTGATKKEGDFTVAKFKVLPVEGKDVVKADFPQSVRVLINPEQTVKLELGKGKVVEMKRYDPDTDCFLTTACTAARGLPDDCAELTILRGLRDSHMRPTTQGNSLVEEYYRIAPGIVRSVNARHNKSDIWNLVYTDLVMPAVALIGENKKEDAVNLYAEYVAWMKEAFVKKMS